MAKNSKNQLPGIAFENGEHLVLVIKPTKLIPIGFWAGAFLCSALLISASILINGGSNLIFTLDTTARSFFMMIILVVLGTIWIATLISTHVYSGNRLYVTNKRLIQNVVTSLFSSSTNVIDLVAVEDVSFKKSGIFEHLFSIGTLRMSTIGSETTYTFKNVDTPTDELETITHLVHIEKGDITDACPPNKATLVTRRSTPTANSNPASSIPVPDFDSPSTPDSPSSPSVPSNSNPPSGDTPVLSPDHLSGSTSNPNSVVNLDSSSASFANDSPANSSLDLVSNSSNSLPSDPNSKSIKNPVDVASSNLDVSSPTFNTPK